MGIFQKSMRAESRKDYTTGVNNATDGICLEQLRTGALLRIADAAELMAKRHQELIDERDHYRRLYEIEHLTLCSLKFTVRGLRGALTRARVYRDMHDERRRRGESS
jgi:hypothetical protein